MHTVVLFENILLPVLNNNKNIVNAGYWVLSENLRNFGCDINVCHPSIQSLGGREGNQVSQLVGGWNTLYFLGRKSCNAFVQPAFFLAGNRARNGVTIFFKFKNLFTLQTSLKCLIA